MPVCRNWQTTATQNRVEKSVWVRVPPPAPVESLDAQVAFGAFVLFRLCARVYGGYLFCNSNATNPNLTLIGERFGFVVFFEDISRKEGQDDHLSSLIFGFL